LQVNTCLLSRPHSSNGKFHDLDTTPLDEIVRRWKEPPT